MVLRETWIEYELSKEIYPLAKSAQCCCKDIRIEFDISKCAVLTNGIHLCKNETIVAPEETGYKYLGELDSILNENVKKTWEGHLHKLEFLLKRKLNGNNLMTGNK